MSTSPKAILFLGATGGSGLATLRRSIAAGYTCVALCRSPERLTIQLNDTEKSAPNLRIEQGNAHDPAAVARCLSHPSKPNSLVDAIVFTIGVLPEIKWTGVSFPDHHVCEKGINTVLEALGEARSKGASGRPKMVAMSTTGMSDHGRDVPLVFAPFYHVALRVPHKDKKAMEKALAASDESYTVVRASFLTDGGKTNKTIRVGIEDAASGKLERSAIGYTISRDDVGRWIFENVLGEGEAEGEDGQYHRKIATITY